MDPETRTALAALNRAFYTRFAGDFARTRRTWPPGFTPILTYVGPNINLLDVGCGNGRLLAFLAAHGRHGAYTGFDGSAQLLAAAAENARALPGQAIDVRFVHGDLLSPAWPARLQTAASRLAGADQGQPPCDPAPGATPDEDGASGGSGKPGCGGRPKYGEVACLAVLHHIPGSDARARFVAQCAALLRPGGALIVSTWQFMSSPRLRARLLPWRAAGLDEADVERGDHLIAWGEGAAGQRYCAAIGEEDLSHLAAGAGLAPVAHWYADGQEGNLNLYGIFRATAR